LGAYSPKESKAGFPDLIAILEDQVNVSRKRSRSRTQVVYWTTLCRAVRSVRFQSALVVDRDHLSAVNGWMLAHGFRNLSLQVRQVMLAGLEVLRLAICWHDFL